MASEAAGAVLEYGLTRLGLTRIVAMVDPGNAAAARVLQKIGLRHVGEVGFAGYDHPDHLYAARSIRSRDFPLPSAGG